MIVVDPGLVASRDGAARRAGGPWRSPPEAVTDVVFSHHHPDHTVNAALFPAARIHDHWAIYDGDLWISREADGHAISPSVRLIATPGHTPEDITTLAATPDGVHACTHAWWAADGPGRRPVRARPGGAGRQPGPDPGRGHGDHPRPRAGLRAGRQHPAVSLHAAR